MLINFQRKVTKAKCLLNTESTSVTERLDDAANDRAISIPLLYNPNVHLGRRK